MSWKSEEHVLAGPFAEILRKACSEVQAIERRNDGPFASRGRMGQKLPRLGPDTNVWFTTSRQKWEHRYADRFAVTHRTAQRHFSLVLSQPTIPVVIADRISALCGLPFAYVEAMATA